MNNWLTQALLLFGVGGFLYMVVLMAELTGHVGRMGEHMASMDRQMQGMGKDMRAMKASMDRMSRVIETGGQQLEQMNPMDTMGNFMPGQGRR